MKKMIVILAVVALTASCFASTITINAVVTGQTATFNYTTSGGVPVGLSMNLARNSGTASIANRAAINDAAGQLKVYIDYAYTNGTANLNATTGIDGTGAAHPIALAAGPGAATLPVSTFPVALSMATLGTAATSGTLCAITFTGSGNFTLSADTANRGGIVDATGAAMTVVFPAAFNVPAGGVCACFGDVNGVGGISLADITAIVGLLTPRAAPTYIPPYTIPVTDPLYAANACADVNHVGGISLADITAIVGALSARPAPTYIPPYTIPCPGPF
jgi:hypothetical protein